MNYKPFAVAGLAIVLCAHVCAAQQYDAPAEEPVENLDVPTPDESAGTSPSATAPSSSDGDHKAGLPYSPYPAGLSWVLTPQPFYVQIRHSGLYYPPHSYVRRCPYYPRGYYWGANWRFNVIGRGNLLFLGAHRFNPYLTAAKSAHHKKTRGQPRYAPPPGPVGQAQLLGSSGPSAPVALPPTSAPGREVSASTDSRPRTKAGASSRKAVVRAAAPRGSARTVSSTRSHGERP